MTDINELLKNTIQRTIKNISIIAIFFVLAIVALSIFGATIDLSTALRELSAPTIFISIGSILLYELWRGNGIQEGVKTAVFKDVMSKYRKDIVGINDDVFQQYLDFEYNRRKQTQIEAIIRKLKYLGIEYAPNINIKKLTHKQRKHVRILRKDKIQVQMAHTQVRTISNLQHTLINKVKEYAPSDKYLHEFLARTKKYLMTITSALFTVGGLSFVLINSNILQALMVLAVAILTLLMSVVFGFQDGYREVTVIVVGIYSTANDYINKAEVYAERNNLQFRSKPKDNTDIVDEITKQVLSKIEIIEEEQK